MRTLIAAVALSALATTTVADTINVPGDYILIQDAIDASVSGDVINIAAGTHYEANLDPGGKAITIQGTLNEDGSPATIVDAQGGGNVFTFVSSEDAETVLSNMVITGGSDAAIDGGGIYCNQSSPTIAGCTINENTSNNRGGGISCYNNSAPTLIECIIADNMANQGGGIHCNNSSPNITDCTITGNQSLQEGGGIHCYNDGNPTITDCTFTNNSAVTQGGGISCQSSSPIISDSAICGNTPDQIYGNYNDNRGNTVADECPILCLGDINDDLIVDGGDLSLLLGAWLTGNAAADINGNGTVDGADLALLLGAWGVCP